MSCIHFILPKLTTKGQAMTPKQVKVPHYQTLLVYIKLQVESFRSLGGCIQFEIYEPDQNYSNNFLTVTNLGVPGIEDIDWDCLAQIAHTEAKGDKKRQHKHKYQQKQPHSRHMLIHVWQGRQHECGMNARANVWADWWGGQPLCLLMKPPSSVSMEPRRGTVICILECGARLATLV